MFFTPAIPFVSTLNETEERYWLEALSKCLPDETILPLSKLSENERKMADVAIVANPDPAALRALPNLVWVHSVWAGVEKLVADSASSNYSIVRLIDPELANTMAEAVLSWTLYLHRDMPLYKDQQSRVIWQPQPYISANERTIGILGLGELGKVSAQRLKANGFNVLGWSRSEKKIEGIECFSGLTGLDALLAQSDILVCLLPLTGQTEDLLDHAMLSKLKPGAKLINFARGKIIDEDALLWHLNTGHIQHAVLDVFQYEPLPRSHIFWTHPSVTVLPHISAPTSVASASEIVAKNIRNYRHLNILPDTVNPQLGY